MEKKKLKVSFDLIEETGAVNDPRIQRKIVHYDEEDREEVGKKRKTPAGAAGVTLTEITETTIIPNSPIIDQTLIYLFVSLSSNDMQLRLESFRKLNEVKAKNISKKIKNSIYRVIENELTKTEGSIQDIRIEALRVLAELPMGKSEMRASILSLLRISYQDPEWMVRSEALKVLEVLIKQTAGFRFSQLETLYDGPDDETLDPFDVLNGLPESFKPNETVFAVLSYVAANDTHHQVRLIAMELLAKVPGPLSKFLVRQSVKKDQCKWDLEKEDSKKKKKKNAKSVEFPLLCCGVFAHGIEDQFVKIRFNALKSHFTMLKGHPSECDNEQLSVFLDALLDECDLIRLTALKLLGRLGQLPLTVSSGLESLLAVLDDQNREIRLEALALLQNNLILQPASQTSENDETMLRSLKCLEAVVAVGKYPEMEGRALEAALKLVLRLGTGKLQKSCPQFYSTLMQTGPSKFLIPPFLLIPFGLSSATSSPALSSIHQIMQIPFLKDSNQPAHLKDLNQPHVRRVQLVKMASRLPRESMRFLREFPEIFEEIEEPVDADEIVEGIIESVPCGGSVSCEQVKLFRKLVVNKLK